MTDWGTIQILLLVVPVDSLIVGFVAGKVATRALEKKYGRLFALAEKYADQLEVATELFSKNKSP